MSVSSLFSLFSSDLAIDLGTANTCVYARGKGIVLNEPSIVAINKVTARTEAVGREAKEMLGRTPGNIVAIRPMRDGVIADFEIAEKMLTYFIKKAHNRTVWVRPRIVVGVPSEITQVEKRAVKDSAYRAKASEVHLVEEAMAAAIGAGMPVTEPAANMVVDIGGGTTDIAVISLAGIVYSKAVRVAGNEMDEAIIQYIKKTYNLLIGERTSETIKMKLGSASALGNRISMEIKGRHLIDGVPKTISITDEEIREALEDTVRVIVDAVRVALERTPPELSADIVDRGIVLTGGGSLLKNLDNRLLMLATVASRRSGLELAGQDIIVNIAGGFRVNEPAADLGIVLALASSLYNRPLEPDLAALGEVGLSGELRAVPQVERRLNEAARLGLTRCVLPETARPDLDNKIPATLTPIYARTLRQALRAVLDSHRPEPETAEPVEDF